MLRKPITYTDLDGKQVTEDFYFHLTKAELIKLEVTQEGGLQAHLQKIIKDAKPAQILEVFEWLLSKSYGKRTDDGKFVKNPQDWAEFVSSEAYSTLFMELVTSGSYAAQFVKAIVPAELGDSVPIDIDSDTELGKVLEQLTAGEEVHELPAQDQEPLEIKAVDEEVPVWYRERRDPTPEELQAMGKAEMLLAFKTKSQGFPPIDA